MSKAQNYTRPPDGIRLGIKGMNTMLPADQLPAGKNPFLQNVRSYKGLQATGRSLLGPALMTLSTGPAHTVTRLNDSTPAGPPSGFALINGGGPNLFLNGTLEDGGYSGNPLSMIPFRPSQSPQPWMYIADSLKMSKIRSDGTVYKMGVVEPQIAPIVGTQTTVVTGSVAVIGTARPWSNVSGQNPSYNYSDNGNGTGPSVINTPVFGASVTLTPTGTATINGTLHSPGDSGPSGSTNPGQFVSTPKILLGAWADASGNLLATAAVFNVGAGTTVSVPSGAAQLQLGIDGIGGNFSGNSGQFTVGYSISTSAVTTVLSLAGVATAYYWGDSPHSGPTASYIWRNPNDTGSSGPSRSTSTAAGQTTGNSLLFDVTPSDNTQPVQWQQLNQDGTDANVTTLFQPALEAAGYQDFNVCVVGSLFVPAAGTYNLTLLAKDNVMWGIGGNATWVGKGVILGQTAQSMTVVSQCPLLPSPNINGSGAATTITVAVTFNGPGLYPIELDWDYWDKTGRTMTLMCNGATIPPLPTTVLEGVQYRFVFRSSATGATSNPSPESPEQQVPAIQNTITPVFSTDPQVDKVDYYRIDDTLDNFTYVGTGPNTNPPTPFTDSLGDADISTNPLLQFDNFEPFPSIDLPAGGQVNVIGGVVTRVSGTPFNTRWLGGTIINIGGVAYVLYNRPTSQNSLIAIGVADGLNLTYEIAEPILAAQPMASMFGNTDNAAYAFAVGDTLRGGTLYFCKGNNLDSAPDTNQIEVTNPSDTLVNGCIENGIGMVLSAEHGWQIFPNFSQAVSTVTGVQGSPFNIVRAGVTRGLYMRNCICTDGSGRFFWRSKEGIEVTSGGAPQQSLTDEDLFNVFPHEGAQPVPPNISVGPYTLFTPDDSRPEGQKLHWSNGYLYYDYLDTAGNPRTIVYDEQAGGWIIDAYQFPASTHSNADGVKVNAVYVGCVDGSVRQMQAGAGELASAVVCTAAVNAGDSRALKTFGDVYIETQSPIGSNIALQFYTNGFDSGVTTQFTPSPLQGVGAIQDYVVDWVGGRGVELVDIEVAFSWLLGPPQLTLLNLWQPTWTLLPETVQNRPTDWDEVVQGGSAGFVQGLILEADSNNVQKNFGVLSADDNVVYVPDQGATAFNGQQIKAFTFTPPFVSHQVKIVSTDGVPWRFGQGWRMQWVAVPYPELVANFSTEPTANGIKNWQTITEFNLAYISTAPITFTMTFGGEGWPTSLSYTLPSSGGAFFKGPNTPVGPNKFKLVSYKITSAQPFRLFKPYCEIKIGQFARETPFEIKNPFGGVADDAAAV